VVGFALSVTAGAGWVTVTFAVCAPVPPGPVQVKVKAVLAVRLPVDCEPPTALAPDQPPEATQDVAFLDDQDNVEAAPRAIVVGEADRLTLGTVDCTDTVADCEAVPPFPVQVRVNVVLLLSAPVDCVPLVAFVPVHPPAAEQAVALVEVQLRVEAEPLAIVLGLAVIAIVGAGVDTETVTDWALDPPGPVQVSVNFVAVLSAPVDCVPLTALAPDQPPEAVHAVALTADHLSAALPPLTTVLGVAERVTVGAVLDTVTVTDWDAVPPEPVQVSMNAVFVVRAPVDCVPLTAFAPDQPPEAVQAVALAAVQLRVELEPLGIVGGFALSVTAGDVPLTLTVTDWEDVPPAPVQVRVYVVFLTSAGVDTVPPSMDL
jgi:hypothetical protein